MILMKGSMIDEVIPREQNGRDTFSRYKAQARSAAMAALSILKGGDVDRVYCDFHDDFVIRKKSPAGYCYIFYQVKTKAKQNHLWKLNEVFGIKEKPTKKNIQEAEDIINSFVGKLFLHTTKFKESCSSIIFQTNINNDDNIEDLLADVKVQEFNNRFTIILIKNLKECYGLTLSEQEIKDNISKLIFETDVQYIKETNNNFEPLVRGVIYEYSEIDLEYSESKEIIIKLLNLVESKSTGIIKEISPESIERQAAISIEDLLSILSISKEAYYSLLKGGDKKAVKNASIIQRALKAAGASNEEIEYCSRCKTKWDIWLRNNRHIIPEFDLLSVAGKIRKTLIDTQKQEKQVSISSLETPIKNLASELKNNNLIYDLDKELLLGGIFSELVRSQ